jgi:hypothetical protein
METQQFEILSAQSNIDWVGKKITGAHNGTINVKNGVLTLKSGKLVIDRTKYEMKFRSGNFFKDLGDTLIYNDFELHVSVTAKAA